MIKQPLKTISTTLLKKVKTTKMANNSNNVLVKKLWLPIKFHNEKELMQLLTIQNASE